MNFKSISLLILIGLFIIVCIQNVEVVPVHFLMWSGNISKLLLLLITLTIGMLIGAIIYGMKIRVNKEDKMDIK